MDEEELERLAREELLREAKRGAERAEECGPSGWLKPKVPKTNKRFLTNTLRSTLFSLKKHKVARDENSSDHEKERRHDKHDPYYVHKHSSKISSKSSCASRKDRRKEDSIEEKLHKPWHSSAGGKISHTTGSVSKHRTESSRSRGNTSSPPRGSPPKKRRRSQSESSS